MTSIAADHSSKCFAWSRASAALVALACVCACGPMAVPRAAAVQVVEDDYVAVPYTPRPPPVEIVPPRPAVRGDLVWADGGWVWNGDRYRWAPGAWVALPPGVKRARWVVVRRSIDGQLFFAPSSWRDASGKAIKAPRALARALTRTGGTASGVQGEADPMSPSSAPLLDE